MADIKTNIKSEHKNKDGRHKKPSMPRYFDVANVHAEDALQKIKVKPESKQKFEGDIIHVDQSVERRPFYKQYKQYKSKFNARGKNAAAGERPPYKQKIIPKELLEKYGKGEKVETKGVKTQFFKAQQERKEMYLDYATEQAARTELLLREESAFIEPEEGEITAQYRQSEIVANVDIQSASKHFKLNLEFGPYRMRYTKNGRHLLLGGRRGHVAAFDWVTKRLSCEMNVMEEVADVQWLHVPTMFAVAQKDWVFFYDNKGTELHCIKSLYCVNRMDFLPYHFLIACGNRDGYASWLDVSIGEMVGNVNTKMGEIRLMRHNPANGVLNIGSGKGVVSMWSPKMKQPLAKLLCHSTAMSALSVDPKGQYLVTAGMERKVKVWDIRQLNGPLAEYTLRTPANEVEISQTGVLAFAQGSYCEMYTDILHGCEEKTPYLRQNCDGCVNGMRFCNYEDVLGIATAKGFQSILVPGSGEPNFDAYEDNPYQTRKQRREQEVHSLLEKIPAELITLDPNEIAGVDVPTLQEKVDAKRAVFYLKPPQIEMSTRRKMKGKGGTAKAAQRKQIVKDITRRQFIKTIRKTKQEIIAETKESEGSADYLPLKVKEKKTPAVFDRFLPKTRKLK